MPDQVKKEPRIEQVYGVFHGGDPRKFTPDEECNTPEEIARWKADCKLWDEGKGKPRPPGCATMGDGSVWTGGGYGLGINEWEVE